MSAYRDGAWMLSYESDYSNLKMARSVGVTILQTLLLRADEVIQ